MAACLCGLVSAIDKSKAIDTSEDLKPEESRQRIYDIIQSHEGRKYGISSIHDKQREHGGHEYEAGEIPLKLASQKQYGYLPYHADEKTPVYYDAPKPKDKVYRENVAAYAAKAPVYVVNAPHHTLAKPEKYSYYTRGSDSKPYGYSVPKSHIQHYAAVDPKPAPQHYALVDPKPHHHYAVEQPKSHIQHYAVSKPKASSQYVYFDEPKSHHKRPEPTVKKTYILEPEPEYVVPDHAVVVKPAVGSHYPVKDYSHHANDHQYLDKSHQSSGHGYHGDSSSHGESGHQAHKAHEIADHKEHSSKAGHHDEHDHHHNK